MPIPKVTVCYVIYNEEKILERSLKSVEGVVDKIIIVHDGPCTDRSLEIAKKYGAVTFIQPKIGEAEPHKPFIFEKVKTPWILMLDADEYLSSELRKELKNTILHNPNYEGFAFQHELMYNGKPLKRKGIARGHRLILFRRDRYTISGLPHDEPKVMGAVKNIDLLLHHRPLYENYSITTFKKKWLKWAKIQAQFMIKQKKAPRPALFYLAKAPAWFVAYFLYYLLYARGYENGIAGLKISFLQGLYNFFLNYYLYMFRRRTALW
jgi:glycosyltransferase involved in cell wall biosynthesis